MAAIMGGGGRGKKGGARRMGVHMDMTPMVDVAFLLLTFFMLSTTLTTPQVMEISLPPDSKAKVEISENNVMTLRVKEDAVFWNIGNDIPKRIEPSGLNNVLKNNLKTNPKLATLIKIDRAATYRKLVDLIDQLNKTQLELGQSEKRFSILTMDATDHTAIASI